MRHESVWTATAELTAHPPLRGDQEVDLVVVGAGLVGLTTALLALRDGVGRVAVLEAGRIGGGTTGGTTGKVTSQHSLIYAELTRRLDRDRAAMYAEANQAGVEQVAALAEEYGIDCELTRAPAYVYSRRSRQAVADEAKAAALVGLPATLTTSTDLPFAVEAAVRFDNQLHIHPVRYLAGLATAVTRAGGVIHEGSRVLDVREQRDDTVRVRTAMGTVRASEVVLATLLPMGVIGGYFAKTRPARSFGLAARLRAPAPLSMAISTESPTHSTRPWKDAGPNGLIVVGGGHETGTQDDTRATYEELERWTRSTFDVDTVDYRWSAQDYTTADRLPYIGRSAQHKRILVATGFKKWGLSNGAAAAIMLSDLIAGRDNPWLTLFDAGRIGDAKAVAHLVKDNLKVGVELVRGHLDRLTADHGRHLAPGEGGLIEVDGHTVGGYRDPEGVLHAVGLTCTHLGCRLRWNDAETSWDCACHGSRFSAAGGDVLEGPAVKPLPVVEFKQP